MIKGKISIMAVFLHLLLIAVPVILFWQSAPILDSAESSADRYVIFCAVPLYVIFTLYAVAAPLVNLKTVIIDDVLISYKYLLRKKNYSLKDVDGYFTMELPSRDNTYETIYPVKNNKILPPISSFYTSNYDEIKKAIPFRNLGKVKFSWKNYLVLLLYKKYNELNK